MTSLTLPARPESLQPLLAMVLSAAAEAGLDAKAQGHVRLAVEEALTNVFSYAYRGRVGGVTVGAGPAPGREGLRVEIRDSGVAFDPLAEPPPDLSVPAKDREAGGLGIFLLRKVMSEVSYRREGAENVLTLVKRPTCIG